MGRRDLIRFQSVHLEGSPKEVAERLRDWAHRAFREVQGRAQKRRLEPEAVEDLIGRIGREPSWVSIEKGDYDPYTPWWRVAKGRDPTTVFLGGFHRLGDTVRLGAVIARLLARGDHYRKAYGILTRGNPWTKADPPADEALFARAIAFPARAPLFEELDWKRINLKRLGRYLPPDLAKPLAHEVRKRIRLRNLRVWEGVALYHDRDVHWLVFEGRAYPLKGEAWELAKPILRKRKLPPLERAQLALTVGELGAWAG